MNDDRCQHVKTAPGQGICTCLDSRMTLKFLLTLEQMRVNYLLARFGLTRDDLPPVNSLEIGDV